VSGGEVGSPFQVVAAASTLNATVAGAEVSPVASVTEYRKSTVPPDHAASVKVMRQAPELNVAVPSEGSGLFTRAQVNGPVPAAAGSTMVTGPEPSLTVIDTGLATGSTRTVAVAGALAVPW